jgi:hypothetical protein
MEQSLLIIFSPSNSNNKFGLDADINNDDDKFWLFDDAVMASDPNDIK